MPVDWVSAQACPLDKRNSKEGCEAVRLINIVEEMGNSVIGTLLEGAFVVVLPGHTHLDINVADLVSRPSFIKGSLLIGRVWPGATSRSPARMSRMHLRAQGTINKMHAWALGFASVTCAFANNLIEMPEWFFSVPMQNLRSNLGVELFRVPQGQWIFFKTCIIRLWTPGFNWWNPLTSWCETLYQEKHWTDPSLLVQTVWPRANFSKMGRISSSWFLRETWPSLTPFRKTVPLSTLASRDTQRSGEIN